MQLPPERPLALLISFALIRTATQIVPAGQRSQFEYEWQHKLYHRWQFLFHTGLWNSREALALLTTSTLAIPAAVQHFGDQEHIRTNVRRVIQSPLTCLTGLAVILTAIAILSGGLPATRDLLFKQADRDNSRLVYIWSHNLRGGGDRPLPADAIEAWKTRSSLISSAAAFRAVHRDVQIKGNPVQRRLIVITEPSFFQVTAAHLLWGSINNNEIAVILSYDAWVKLFHASPGVIGGRVSIAGTSYFIRGILPPGFEPISRQPALYLVHPHYLDRDAYAVVKAKPGANAKSLDKNFSNIAQNVTYYFLQGQLRYGFVQSEAWAPARSFAVAALASALMLLMVFRVKWRSVWPRPNEASVCLRRSTFFAAKTILGLACVFTGCLEWSRSTSAILFGNFDPATGPFLLWLYILGTMGVFFWAAFDQKARCRQCLQLLAFPVRMGSPGSLLLDWAGIELCCTQGHGVLHVPHLAPSWADESDHWITLDESWQSVFGPDKHR